MADGGNQGPFGEKKFFIPGRALALRSKPGAVLAAWSWVTSSAAWSSQLVSSAAVGASSQGW